MHVLASFTPLNICLFSSSQQKQKFDSFIDQNLNLATCTSMDEYLGRSCKLRTAIATYERLRLEHPGLEIPHEIGYSAEPDELVRLMASNPSASVPRYWRTKRAKIQYTQEYALPAVLASSGILQKRIQLYSQSLPEERKSGMGVSEQRLAEHFSCYAVSLVKDCCYDGSDTFFIRKAVRGVLSDNLQAALGQAGVSKIKK